MTAEQGELLRQIEAFQFEDGERSLTFVARLARENAWARSYAERVVREYKRYVFLAMCSNDVPRCPSEDVDAAWHLHLTYTRNYWKQFCGEILRKPLHHEPTRGGQQESEKHVAMYDKTLLAYRETFGELPPTDIWPPGAQRFGSDIQHRKVNTAANWIIPKQPIQRVLQITAALVLSAVILPGCGGGLNPFELKGVEFLYFLVPAMVVAVALGRMQRWALRGPGPLPDDDDNPLTWEQAAYLAGGYPRLTSAAIAQLARENVVRVAGDSLEQGENDATNRSAVENAIINQLPIRKSQLKSVHDAVEAKFAHEASRLEEDGFAIAKSQRVLAGVASLMPLMIVILGFGLPRLLMGIANHKPVAFLVATLILGSVFGMFACLRGLNRCSRRGQSALASLRKQHGDNRSDVGVAVALFGTTILAGTALAYMNNWYPRSRPTSVDGGCGAGCGSADGGGGGGGCGGGGCGGCGGGGD